MDNDGSYGMTIMLENISQKFAVLTENLVINTLDLIPNIDIANKRKNEGNNLYDVVKYFKSERDLYSTFLYTLNSNAEFILNEAIEVVSKEK